MANEEQLKRLTEEGVEAWNAWRSECQDEDIDLSGADLSGADLSLVNLRKADILSGNLTRADLNGADLSEANLNLAKLNAADLSLADLIRVNLRSAELHQTDLSLADLSLADLSGAKLVGADLFGVNLSLARLIKVDLGGANLSEALISETDLSGANLHEANLYGAYLNGANLAACDLSEVNGLESITHYGPSSIGIDTIFRSSGRIPHEFLRGCGVPDVFIEYMSSLTGKAFEYYSAFISYSSENEAVASRIHADLQNSGVRCWYAPHDMRIGAKIRSTIHEAIRVHEKLLLILSEDAINSDWVEDEVETALARERGSDSEILFPIRIDDAVMNSDAGWAASLRRKRHIGDFRQWKDHDAYQEAFQRLLRDLKGKSMDDGRSWIPF